MILLREKNLVQNITVSTTNFILKTSSTLENDFTIVICCTGIKTWIPQEPKKKGKEIQKF